MTKAVSNIAETGLAGALLHDIAKRKLYFEKIKMIEKTVAPVFDVLIPEDHSYIGNGIVNHNCQGSEFPCVVLVIHKQNSFMHHRNLFYTGVTRARKTAIIIGDNWGIRNCAQKRQVSERKTFLSHILPIKKITEDA